MTESSTSPFKREYIFFAARPRDAILLMSTQTKGGGNGAEAAAADGEVVEPEPEAAGEVATDPSAFFFCFFFEEDDDDDEFGGARPAAMAWCSATAASKVFFLRPLLSTGLSASCCSFSNKSSGKCGTCERRKEFTLHPPTRSSPPKAETNQQQNGPLLLVFLTFLAEPVALVLPVAFPVEDDVLLRPESVGFVDMIMLVESAKVIGMFIILELLLREAPLLEREDPMELALALVADDEDEEGDGATRALQRNLFIPSEDEQVIGVKPLAWPWIKRASLRSAKVAKVAPL